MYVYDVDGFTVVSTYVVPEVTSPSRFVPRSLLPIRYPFTPDPESVEALHDSVTCVGESPVALKFVGVVGAVLSVVQPTAWQVTGVLGGVVVHPRPRQVTGTSGVDDAVHAVPVHATGGTGVLGGATFFPVVIEREGE